LCSVQPIKEQIGTSMLESSASVWRKAKRSGSWSIFVLFGCCWQTCKNFRRENVL